MNGNVKTANFLAVIKMLNIVLGAVTLLMERIQKHGGNGMKVMGFNRVIN